MRITFLILGIIAVILIVFSMAYVSKNYFRRQTGSNKFFEVYKENEMLYALFFFASGASALILIVVGSMPKEEVEPPLFLPFFVFMFSISFLYLAMRISRRSVVVKNDKLFAYSGLFLEPRELSFTDIFEAKISRRYLTAFNGKGDVIFKINTASKNYTVLLEKMKKNNIKKTFSTKNKDLKARKTFLLRCPVRI